MKKCLAIATLLTAMLAQAGQSPPTGCFQDAECDHEWGDAYPDDIYVGAMQWCQNASTQSSSWCCITTYYWYYPNGDTGVPPVIREMRQYGASNPAYCYPYVANGQCNGPGEYSCVSVAPPPPGAG